MRCKACNDILSDYEVRRKDTQGNFVDLCGGCYRVSSRVVAEATTEPTGVDAVMTHGDQDNTNDILEIIGAKQ